MRRLVNSRALQSWKLEVAADWHGLVVPRRGMKPSNAGNSGQVDPRRSTTRQTYHRPQSAALGLHPVVRRLLLINRPRKDGTLSWRWYPAATGGIRTRDLAIAKSGTVPLGHRAPHTT